MHFKHILGASALTLMGATAQAASFNTVEVDMPGGVPALLAERADWSAGLGALTSEGFEGEFVVSEMIDFGAFSITLTGATMQQFSGANAFTRTEGDQSLGFDGSAVLTFNFDDAISAFGMDWSSLQDERSTIDYADSEGNTLNDIFPSTNAVTAGFFGVSGVNLTSLSFTVDSTEILEFDFIQFETAAVPLPAAGVLLIGGLGGLGALRRRKKS